MNSQPQLIKDKESVSSFFWILGWEGDMKVVLEQPSHLWAHGQTPHCHTGSAVAEELVTSGRTRRDMGS